eukprot:39241-Pyramimonas_sp.AAC.1
MRRQQEVDRSQQTATPPWTKQGSQALLSRPRASESSWKNGPPMTLNSPVKKPWSRCSRSWRPSAERRMG